MPFKFDIAKAIESAATLLRLTQRKSMSRKRMLALLYMSDRDCLEKTGRPIIGGNLFAMDYGPIHSEVYDLIKGGHNQQECWSRYFSNESYFVHLSVDPGVSALSRYETRILSEYSEKFMGLDDWDVADATHDFIEYKEAYAGRKRTSQRISDENLLEAVGLGGKKDKIMADAKEKLFFDQLFGA